MHPVCPPPIHQFPAAACCRHFAKSSSWHIQPPCEPVRKRWLAPLAGGRWWRQMREVVPSEEWLECGRVQLPPTGRPSHLGAGRSREPLFGRQASLLNSTPNANYASIPTQIWPAKQMAIWCGWAPPSSASLGTTSGWTAHPSARLISGPTVRALNLLLPTHPIPSFHAQMSSRHSTVAGNA